MGLGSGVGLGLGSRLGLVSAAMPRAELAASAEWRVVLSAVEVEEMASPGQR